MGDFKNVLPSVFFLSSYNDWQNELLINPFDVLFSTMGDHHKMVWVLGFKLDRLNP